MHLDKARIMGLNDNSEFTLFPIMDLVPKIQAVLRMIDELAKQNLIEIPTDHLEFALTFTPLDQGGYLVGFSATVHSRRYDATQFKGQFKAGTIKEAVEMVKQKVEEAMELVEENNGQDIEDVIVYLDVYRSGEYEVSDDLKQFKDEAITRLVDLCPSLLIVDVDITTAGAQEPQSGIPRFSLKSNHDNDLVTQFNVVYDSTLLGEAAIRMFVQDSCNFQSLSPCAMPHVLQ